MTLQSLSLGLLSSQHMSSSWFVIRLFSGVGDNDKKSFLSKIPVSILKPEAAMLMADWIYYKQRA